MILKSKLQVPPKRTRTKTQESQVLVPALKGIVRLQISHLTTVSLIFLTRMRKYKQITKISQPFFKQACRCLQHIFLLHLFQVVQMFVYIMVLYFLLKEIFSPIIPHTNYRSYLKGNSFSRFTVHQRQLQGRASSRNFEKLQMQPMPDLDHEKRQPQALRLPLLLPIFNVIFQGIACLH